MPLWINPTFQSLFVQTNTLTYANSVAVTNLLGTGIGITTLPANFWIIGRQIRIKGNGIYSTALAGPSLAINTKLGSVQLATGTIAGLVSSASNLGFSFEILITCRSVGASGTVIIDGSLSFATSISLLTINTLYLNNGGSTSTIDTTASQQVIINGTWGTQSVSNSLSLTTATIEQFN